MAQEKESKQSTSAEVSFIEMIFPEHANHYGTLFAGNALKMLTKAAYVAASRFARGDVVVASCREVNFHAPIKTGQALSLTAHIQRVGRSSMTVTVSGMVEDLTTCAQRHVMEGSFEMVAVDAAGRPFPFIPAPAESIATTDSII